jgi:hypothetical protein
MMLVNETTVRETLRPYEAALVQAILGGWEDWRALQLGGRLRFVARSRACLVYDFIAQRAIAALAGDADVHVTCHDETAKFLFGKRVLLRFKKANYYGLGSNIQTQATLGFVDQQLDLPGFPNMHKVELVYVLNHLRTQIDQAVIVARDGDACLWSYPLPMVSDAVVPVPMPVPSADEPQGPRIKIRPADTEKKEATGG